MKSFLLSASFFALSGVSQAEVNFLNTNFSAFVEGRSLLVIREIF